MIEWAILTEDGSVVLNIAMKGGTTPPWCREGTKAVPLNEVPENVRKTYRYWNERP